MLLGATGTIGRATLDALLAEGFEVTCVLRPDAARSRRGLPERAILRFADVTDPASLARDGFAGDRFDVLVSCLASRTGRPRDAWAIDYRAHADALRIAQGKGVRQMILLSAICVQRPMLAFQHAKLAFEALLARSGLDYSIIRPTAYFKSLSGQVERVRQGRPFLIFGDGRLTSCKPIGDADLGRYIAGSIGTPERRNRILPIGGPGPAITPPRSGGGAVPPAGAQAGLSPCARRLDERHRHGPARGGLPLPVPARQDGTSAHRPLLRHELHAGAECCDRPLRRRRDAIDRQGDAVRFLRAAASR